MLVSLDIRDVLIIDHLELTFQPGLNVLTGETGAGKSILLDSLGFVLGWRGRAELVRQGAAQGEVIAEFVLPPDHPAHAILAEAGLPSGENVAVAPGQQRAIGRKTGWVNDRRGVWRGAARNCPRRLWNCTGNRMTGALLKPRACIVTCWILLRGWTLGGCRAAWSALAKARKAQAQAESQMQSVQAEEEFLRHAVAELDPRAGP